MYVVCDSLIGVSRSCVNRESRAHRVHCFTWENAATWACCVGLRQARSALVR